MRRRQALRREAALTDDRRLPNLSLQGCREHNLKGLDLELPFGRWIAVSGPSGSGKTSLMFDTVVRASQRRFLGALSPRARQFLGKLGRADVAAVAGLPVTVAIGARRAIWSYGKSGETFPHL